MTEEEKQNKKAAYQLACLVKDSAYCEFCPVSDGCKDHDKLTKQDKEAVQDLMAFKARYKNGK